MCIDTAWFTCPVWLAISSSTGQQLAAAGLFPARCAIPQVPEDPDAPKFYKTANGVKVQQVQPDKGDAPWNVSTCLAK